MRKLEYDKSMEDLKSKALENDCPGDMHIIKYSDGVWATNRKSPSGTTDAILASKYACINHAKCGLVGLINKEPNWNDAKKEKTRIRLLRRSRRWWKNMIAEGKIVCF
ncbi:hypothetical protein L3Y34_003920 [Caenorhabditis briggsae]|uniref:Uncharacterized protein n=1 Tax=Caenorhabditis briggsae TaxID=6238 RepID=A0AAE9A8S4_CAEBR|nr:hypothetical protein L3Y34_003920 [Caenorhabditis briggsae]